MNKILEYIIIKYKIYRYHKRFGKYEKKELTEKEYNNFYIKDEDKIYLDRFKKIDVKIETQNNGEIPFIVRTKI